MGKGFDCATPLTLAKAREFVTSGFTFVCRYLAPTGSWKRLTAVEANNITEAGLWIVSVFERGADNALAGAAQGTEDGRLALQYAKEIGQPEGSVIYAAVDTDVNSSHYAAVEAYLRAFDAQIDGYELGVYGEYEICKAMRDRGVVSKVWQTRAWSQGRVIENYNIYQHDLGATGLGFEKNGMLIDEDLSNGDAGGWKIGMAIKKEGTDNMPMKLEQWQWGMLYEVMGKAYNADQLNWNWMQKIVDKTLTAAELAFLNTVLDGRIDRKIEV
ncbi:hypothetical protein GCM10023310_01120 [Paenibacillus vulneris]|uniref:Glycoside hydrolase domain-containing protein n=1 Tax=Paenibacillus vulneris TaxID=1133364 RepID=A0ABW3UYY4_9BACL